MARIAPLDDAQQRHELAAISGNGGYAFYEGVKNNYGAIFNVQPPLFRTPKLTWQQIKTQIRASCTSSRKSEVERNQEVGKALYQYARAHNVVGAEVHFRPLALGMFGTVMFSLPIMLKIDGKNAIPFIDARQTKGLTEAGRRFVFSVNHTHIREQHPDYAGVGFVIFQFPNIPRSPLKAVAHFDGGVELWDTKAIEEMVNRTYRTRVEVLKRAA